MKALRAAGRRSRADESHRRLRNLSFENLENRRLLAGLTAPPLPDPTGVVVRVTTAQELEEAATHLSADTTILLSTRHVPADRYTLDYAAQRDDSG